jgi:general secretion pathway protein J
MMLIRATRGFTLLEMLIGLALIGLMTLALFSALRFGTHSWERSEAKSLQVVDYITVENVLRREMGKAFPMRVGLANENKVAFEGDGSKVKFFTTLPAHFSAGGLSRVELRYEPGSNRQDAAIGGTLVLRHALQDGQETELPDGDETSTSRLLQGIESLSIAYFGRDSDTSEPTWRDAWQPTGRLPQLVRFTMTLAGVSTPREFIIPIRMGEEAGCYQASFQRVCGPRR